MGFVKCVFRKICHIIEDFVCNLLRNTSGNTARNAFRFISINEVFTLLLHDRRFFLTHGTANKVRSSKCIACKLLYNLHYLFLVHNTTISWFQNASQFFTIIGNGFRMIFSLNILRNKVHWTWTIQGNSRNNIF